MSPFTLERFAEILREIPAAPCYWVAYSGGLDSHVLLHALASLRERLPGRLAAVHVDHGLSPDAPRWAAHCRAVCAGLDVPLELLHADAAPGRGESPEAAARAARYRALAGLMGEGDCLLTAHHQDDQAETLLLQLLRGAGPHGLAAMPFRNGFAAGSHVRPLLDFGRTALAAYAREAKLSWVEDESNFDTGIRRNFLRHQVLPLLRERWPRAAITLARSASHCADAAILLDRMAAADLENLGDKEGRRLHVPALRRLEGPRRRNLLRYWCRHVGLPLPRAAHLRRIEVDLLQSPPDRMPLVRWPGAEVRRYRDWLHALPPRDAFDATVVLSWNLEGPLPLPGGNGLLTARRIRGGGLRAPDGGAGVEVRFRRGGERCRMADGRHHPLKKLLQEKGVPPWERDRLPLIYVEGELAAVADLWICRNHAAAADEPGWRITWDRGGSH
ncbi:MAG TPA: tRNA lysidine(34) synthetase TilS [Gammaproteobacteria bacterium]|nr:tRNA lysidine(34) synthetase TilS [Gammaproteobacteria bacterium]